MTGQIRCHYEVLNVPRDADAATVKKAHRKAALKHHPDKTVNKTEEEQNVSATEFKLIQAAYECLSDPVERKWYDEHRGMILSGGMDGNGGAGDGGDGSTFLYDVMPFQYAGCYDGFDDDDSDSFYSVYNEVFDQIFQGEKDGFISEGNIDIEKMSNIHLSEVHLGDSTSNWEDILAFYNTWEGFTSCLSFAWEDTYQLIDIKDAPNRRIRRLMEEDNKKKRKGAKKERVEDVSALVRFVKRRDLRVKVQREKSLREQASKDVERKKEAVQRKKEHAAAKEEWRLDAERRMAEQEAADLNAGRTRLADLDSDDDYDYGGKRGRKGKKGKRKSKGKGGKKNNDMQDNDESGKEDDADIENTETSSVDQEGRAVKEDERKKEAARRKIAAVKEEWRVESERRMAGQEAADIDLDSGRKKKGKRRGKGGKGGKNNNAVQTDEDNAKDETTDLESTEATETAVEQDASIRDENDAIHDDDEKKVENNTPSLPADDNEEVADDNEEAETNADANIEDDLRDVINNTDLASLDSSSSEEESSSSEEEEPDSWRCECCRKDFKSAKQFENHERSKKHKEMLKKYTKRLQKEAEEEAALCDMMDEIDETDDEE